jgi:hypothetical protein
MNDAAKLEISIIAAALTLGLLGDALLRSFPWGLNFALFVCALGVAIVFLGRSRREAFAEGGYWLLLPIALFSLAFLWHDSPALKALNVLALLTALSLIMLRAQGGRLRVSSLVEYALSSIIAGLNSALGIVPLLFGTPEWKKSLNGESRRAVALLRGAVLSVPLLLIFGALFMGADAVFRRLVTQILNVDLTHFVVFAFIAYCVGGYLRGLLFGKELKWARDKRFSPPSLGAIEMVIMLGLLDVLFLAFVVVEIRYFFGGAALVQATTGLTYADYARRGFFELLAVAALLLPFLLLIHWLMPRDNHEAQSWYRWLAGVQIALLFIIMVSAFQRMRLYQAEYGLSEQRLYPTAFMGWLAVAFVWFALTVLRGRRERFAFGAMMAGFLLIAVLHVLNPDALIARTNLARARVGRPFDAHYASSLSADAVPELVAGLSDLNPGDRCILAKRLLERGSPPEKSDWRSWNRSRAWAWKALHENERAIRAAVCSHPDFSTMTH